MIYSNGVTVLEGQFNGWLYRAIVVPATSIQSATIVKPSSPTTVEGVNGDIVFNISPFDTAGNPNLGLRIGGSLIRAYVDYNPFLYWSSAIAHITHYKTTFNAQPTAAQGFRYLIENGVKNARYTSDWNFKSARRLIATNIAGDTIIITTQGVSGQEAGLTLHECVDLAFSLDATLSYMMDADSGGSAQDYIKIDSVKSVMRGDANEIRSVPVFGVINLKSPTTGGTPTPEVPHITHTIDIYSDGSITIDGNPYP